MKLYKYFFLVAIFFLLPHKEAEAACVQKPGYAFGTVDCANEGEAFAWNAATSNRDARCRNAGVLDHKPTWSVNSGPNYYQSSGFCYNASGTNSTFLSIAAFFGTTCAQMPPTSGFYPGIPNNTLICKSGCEQTYTTNGTTGTSTPTGATCDPSAPCPAGTTADPANPGICKPSDRDGDGVPDTADAFPDDPNESQDTDGDGVGDNGDLNDNDPDNGQDDGEGDESDNTSTGGGNCKSPPNSSGDAILASIAYQTWSTRCAAEKLGGTVTGDPTNCNGTYTCSGDQIQCAQVAVMRKNACAAQTANGDANGNGQPDWTEVGDGGVSTSGDPQQSAFNRVIAGGMGAIDQGGILSNRSCPQLGTITLPANLGTFSFDSEPWFCDLLAMIKAAMTFLGTFIAMRILLGDRS